jgi:CheY-like chemotaxis protein
MPNKPRKILILDDDYESMQSFQVYIERELSLDAELSAEKSLLQRFDQEKFDLLIVDLMIHPRGMNADNQEVENIHYDGIKWDRTGLEFIRRFRKGEYTQKGHGTCVDVPIIVMSAVSDSATVGEWGRIIQNEHHMEKPFRLSEFMNLMRMLLQE